MNFLIFQNDVGNFPIYFEFKSKIRCWKVTVGWPRPGDSRGLGSDWALRLLQLKFNAPRPTHPSTVTFTEFLTDPMMSENKHKSYPGLDQICLKQLYQSFTASI